MRPSDGSPRARQRVDGAAGGRRASRPSCASGCAQQDEPQVVVKDPHAAWVLPLWQRAAAGRRPRPADADRAAAPGRGGRLAGPHLGRGPAYGRRAPGQGDLQHAGLAQRRAGHRARLARGAAGVHPVRRPARRLAPGARPGLRAARPRLPLDAGARARRVPRPRAAPLPADLGRHRAARLAPRPRRGHLAAARRPGRRPGRRGGAARLDGAGRAYDAHYAEAVARLPRRGPAPRAPRHGRRRGQAPRPAPRRARPGARRPRRGWPRGGVAVRARSGCSARSWAGRGRGTGTRRTRRSAGSARPPPARSTRAARPVAR